MDPLTVGAIYVGAKALEAAGKGYDERQKWRARWRSLHSGMSPAAVTQLIGAPNHIQVDGPVTLYKYSMRGRIAFVAGQLMSWSEPKL